MTPGRNDLRGKALSAIEGQGGRGSHGFSDGPAGFSIKWDGALGLLGSVGANGPNGSYHAGLECAPV